MPEALSSVLFLGDRSPYGLSVARAILASRLSPRRVIVPAGAAGESAIQDAAAIEPAGETSAPGGEAIVPLRLDPGVTSEELEAGCRAGGIDWVRVDRVDTDEIADSLRGVAPLFLAAGFPMRLPARLLSLPSEGAFEFHPSLLPRCRGGNPIFWTLATGETQGGVTALYMTPELQAGDIVAQIPLPLSEEDDYRSLYQRAMKASHHLVEMLGAFLLDGKGHVMAQDPDRATCHPEDGEEDHRVHWAGRSPREVVALARTGRAFTTARGERLGILKAAEVRTVARERRHAAPGRVLAINESALVVEASGGAVALRWVAWRGRRHGGGELARALGLRRNEVLV